MMMQLRTWQPWLRHGLAPILTVTAATLASCAGPAAGQEATQWRVEAVIHPTLPPFTLVLEGTVVEDQAQVEAIAIYVGAAETPRQRLTGLETQFPDLVQAGLVIEDLDFNGFQDLRLPQFLPASPNIPYHYWLYNPETGLFERQEALEEAVTSPTVDAERQVLQSFQRVSANTYVVGEYQFQEGEPVLVRETTEIYTPDGYKRVIVKAWRGGEWAVVADDVVAVEGE